MREMLLAMLDGKEPTATQKQELDVQAAILAALRKRSGTTVAGEGDVVELERGPVTQARPAFILY
jgi:hypothetical protein